MKSTNKTKLKATPKFKVGEFVRWYEAYADGFLGRDAGWGVVKSVKNHIYHGEYFTYNILRNKHGDVMSFAEDYIESKQEFEERMEQQRREEDEIRAQADPSVRS